LLLSLAGEGLVLFQFFRAYRIPDPPLLPYPASQSESLLIRLERDLQLKTARLADKRAMLEGKHDNVHSRGEELD